MWMRFLRLAERVEVSYFDLGIGRCQSKVLMQSFLPVSRGTMRNLVWVGHAKLIFWVSQERSLKYNAQICAGVVGF